jgi:hypothetical protein
MLQVFPPKAAVSCGAGGIVFSPLYHPPAAAVAGRAARKIKHTYAASSARQKNRRRWPE